ncbi:MAG: ADP-ribosyltransferase [Lachnospiraceae bacterium]|nr:ADP-ribosyltransferase [Lachnospiraceae bacterium]
MNCDIFGKIRLNYKNDMEKYKKFFSVKEARIWGEKNYSYWLPKYQLGGSLRHCFELDDIERLLLGGLSLEDCERLKEEALEYKWFSYYCGGNWGLALNEKLRYGFSKYGFPEEDLNEMMKVMDSRLNHSFIPENLWGYRFLEYRDLCRSMGKKHIFCGTIIEDKGYMGVGLVESALSEDFGVSYNTLLKIMIPQGAKGLYMDLISNRSDEQELLLARGSHLRVLFRYRYNKKRILVCKLVQP